MSTIDSIYNKIETDLLNDPKKLKDLKNNLTSSIHTVFQSTIVDNKGYCMKFKIPNNKVETIIQSLEIDQQDMEKAIIQSWDLPVDKKMPMYGNVYYHFLLVLFLFGVRNNMPDIYTPALQLILFRVWNGRLNKAIKFCDEKTMNYVVNYMITKRNLFKKYADPFQLITNYFTPTLIEKYKDVVKSNPKKLKLLFNQCYSRIFQILYQSFGVDLTTNTTKAKSGIALLYYKAKEEGMNMQTPLQSLDQQTFADQFSSNNYEELIETILTNIMMNTYQDYDSSFIDFIIKNEKMNKEGISKIISSIHSVKHEKYLQDIITLIINIINPTISSDICNNTFFERIVKPKLISSKHSKLINKLKDVLNEFLNELLMVHEVDFKSYSSVRQAQFRNVVIYLISFNIQKYICSNG